MKVCYIAGRYRGATISETVKNIRAAEKIAMGVWQDGDVALCPHLNTALMDGICPDEHFLKGDMELLKRCDCIIMIPGWSTSLGAIKEYEMAKELGMDITFIWEDPLTIEEQ